VPVGTIFRISLSKSHVITATTRWCDDDRMGVEFAAALQRDSSGRIAAINEAGPDPIRKPILRKAS
jgi:hypothetical protein